MEGNNNIRILFTAKANSALDNIMKDFSLEETDNESVERDQGGKLSKVVVIDHLSKDFARGTISEKNLIDSLQKDLNLPQQKAQQVSKEIITKIIPFLEKVPEEKLKNPIFVEEINKKIFGEPTKSVNASSAEIIDVKNLPKIDVNEVMEKTETTAPPQETPPQKRTRKSISSLKQSVPQTKQSSGPDNYREPIE